jgi:hypothetical protein
MSSDNTNNTNAPTPPTNNPSKPASAANRGKKNSMQNKARSAFNASAGSMSVEKFFTDFTEIRRNNVDIEMDLGFQERLAAPYADRAKEHSTYVLQLEQEEDLPKATSALISIGIARKLMMTIPESQSVEVSALSDLLSFDLYLPKASIAAIDNLGKFEHDNLVCRMKYQVQDTARILLKTSKLMNTHSRFRGRFLPPPGPQNYDGTPKWPNGWTDFKIDNVVVPSKGSASWIRDQAQVFLDKAYERHWEVPYGPEDDEGNQARINVSYPRLPVSKSLEAQLRNVTDWLGLLSVDMPDVEVVVAAGICTAWDHFWFNISHWDDAGVAFPDWVPQPDTVLDIVEVCVVRLGQVDLRRQISMINDYLVVLGPVLDQFLDRAKQPENKFGSAAQLISIPEVNKTSKNSFGLVGATYQAIKRGTQGRAFVKVTNKGLVTMGSIFGFTKKVEVNENYLAMVNGDPDTLKLQFVRPDFKNVLH